MKNDFSLLQNPKMFRPKLVTLLPQHSNLSFMREFLAQMWVWVFFVDCCVFMVKFLVKLHLLGSYPPPAAALWGRV